MIFNTSKWKGIKFERYESAAINEQKKKRRYKKFIAKNEMKQNEIKTVGNWMKVTSLISVNILISEHLISLSFTSIPFSFLAFILLYLFKKRKKVLFLGKNFNEENFLPFTL